MANSELIDAIAAERRAIADWLEGLTPEQLATPSLCEGWTVQDVAAHLTTLCSVSFPAMTWRIMKAGGSFPKAVDRLTHDLSRRRPTSALVAGLRANATNGKHPPTVPAAPLTDAIVHGEDMRRPLGAVRDVPLPAARTALEFVASGRDRGTFVPRGRLRGLRLVATDQDWASGEGDEIRGASLPLLLGALGRKVALPELTGAVNALQGRL